MSCSNPTREDGSKAYPFIFRSGLTATLELVAAQRSGAVYDLTGRTGTGSVRRNIGDEAAYAAWTVALTSPTRGLAEATLGADVTAALNGLYVTDFEFALSSTDVVGSMMVHLRFDAEVTR